MEKILFDSTKYDDDEDLDEMQKGDCVAEDWNAVLAQADLIDNGPNFISIVVNGVFQRWDGPHELAKNENIFGSMRKALQQCMPDYDASIKLVDDPVDGLVWTQSDHDAPMGGTRLVISRLDEKFNALPIHLA